MKRKWNAAVTGFCIFLVFMGICTVVAKGIYASGLPRVTLDNPSKKSISHEISAGGTVLAGAERFAGGTDYGAQRSDCGGWGCAVSNRYIRPSGHY